MNDAAAPSPAAPSPAAPSPAGAEIALRGDLQMIADIIGRATRVLDIGCGDGALLHYLVREKAVDGRGIELSTAGVHACVTRGLAVIQGDANTDLADYPSDAFDYAVLSQTLQATQDPHRVLGEMVRIARHAIVSFTNYGHWRIRWRFVTSGRMPVVNGSDDAGQRWYATPNIHPCTLRDFIALCDELGLRIERSVSFDRRGAARELRTTGAFANLRGQQAVFLLTRG